MNVVSLREFVFVIVGSVVLSLVVVGVVFPWARHIRTLIAIALTTTIGIVIWNALLNLTNATSLNVDSPLLGLSVQDVESGVGAPPVALWIRKQRLGGNDQPIRELTSNAIK